MGRGSQKKVLRIPSEKKKRLGRQYVNGYRRKPEDPSWGEVGAKLLSRALPREKW